MFATIINKAIVQGIPLLFGSTGEIITEKSGNLNLGIPGIMYVGGSAGIIGAYLYEHYVDVPHPALCIIIPLLCSLIGSGLLALIYSFLTITLRANQNVTGLALTTFGVGFGDFFGGSLTQLVAGGGNISVKTSADCFKQTLPFAKNLGWFGEIFLNYGFLVYVAIFIAIVATWFLNRTRTGLHLRAVGENPATADAAGINVTKYKYLATVIGGMIAGLGGFYFIMDYTGGSWTNGGFGDRGWLAIALVIFALWKPSFSILGSIIFGGLYIAYNYISGIGRSSVALFNMLPYIVTIVVLIFTSIRNKKENQPPQSLGLAYFREER
ncbi:MAG: ABC transporter permease [Clostridia bacterium]|nr:ABC transporter permease [Clostridia bacterium]